ncbi:hypothetical protein QM600_29575, partial [Rhodococcus sp. IEGM 1379]|nr:hypothetical protein [Rhodococcus sp. IEGM 1379]
MNETVPAAEAGVTVAVRSTAAPVVAVAGTSSARVVATSTAAGLETVTVDGPVVEATKPVPEKLAVTAGAP